MTKNTNGAVIGADWNGDMASSYDDAGNVLGKKHTVNLKGILEDLDTNTQKISVSGDVAIINAAGTIDSKLSFGAGSYMIHSQNQNGQDALSLQFSLSTPTWTINGQLTNTNLVADKSGLNYDPTHFEFKGSVKDDTGVEFFNGSVVGDNDKAAYAQYNRSKPDSATNFTVTTIRMKGTVTIPNRPILAIDLSGSQPAFDTSRAQLVYTQGSDPSVTMTASHAAGNSYYEYTAINSQGVGMKWKSTDTSAALTRNDITLGTADFNNSRITYTDGSFEQF